jgi:hypothetical protein
MQEDGNRRVAGSEASEGIKSNPFPGEMAAA